jgi:hypothetical protein
MLPRAEGENPSRSPQPLEIPPPISPHIDIPQPQTPELPGTTPEVPSEPPKLIPVSVSKIAPKTAPSSQALAFSSEPACESS